MLTSINVPVVNDNSSGCLAVKSNIASYNSFCVLPMVVEVDLPKKKVNEKCR